MINEDHKGFSYYYLALVLEVDAGDQEDQGDEAHGEGAEQHQVEDGGVQGDAGPRLPGDRLLLVLGQVVHGVEDPVAEVP